MSESALSLQNRVSAALKEIGNTHPKLAEALRALAGASPVAAGAEQVIAIPFAFGDFAGLTKTATTQPPATAILLDVQIKVDIAFNAGTVAAGTSTTADRFLASGDTDLTDAAPNVQGGDYYGAFGSGVGPRLTFTGAPVSGSGTAYFRYVTPQG